MEERQEIISFSPQIPIKVFMNKLGFVSKHWHNSLELLMVLDGIIDITIDNVTYTLKSEDIILVNSNCIHEIRSESAVMITLQIDLSKLTQFDDNLVEVLFDCNTSTTQNKELFQGIQFCIATIIKENMHTSNSSKYRDCALCYYLISELLTNFQVTPTETVKKQHKYMTRLTRILNYIELHYAENFSLSELADVEGLSAPYLSNFFNTYMGINFSQYYTNVKLEHAISDLLSTQDTIETISLRNGFTESHSLVRCFKKKYGVSPSVYRTNYQHHKNNDMPSDNINYLLIESSNYLHLLTKYIDSSDAHRYQVAPPSTTNTVTTNVSFQHVATPLRHTFKTFITVGRAKELLNSSIQSMLRDLQQNIGYKYIKFHGILSDDMMVVSRKNNTLQFQYTLVDMALDFLLSINLKPMIQLSFMPTALASDSNKTIFYSSFNTSPPKDMNEWELLITDFTRHLLERYGEKEVLSWLFTVWNEPNTSTSMFGFENYSIFFNLYKCTYHSVKKVCPSICFGSPSFLYMENLDSDVWFRKFIHYATENKCIPEFLNVHYYSDIISPSAENNFTIGLSQNSNFPKHSDDFSKWIKSLKKLIKSLGLKDLPLYLTEWNFTLSHRNLINDTCFKSCYILKNLLENYDQLDSFGYWSLTDLLEENPLPDMLFHGGLGIYTMNGLRKNVFYSFYFLNMLGNQVLDANNGYFITRKENSIQIITYNYIHYGNLFSTGELFDVTQTNRYSPFDMSQHLQFHFNFSDIKNGRYEIREYYVNRDYGSAFDIWVHLGGLPLDPFDTEFLRGLSTPGYHKECCLVSKESMCYSTTLDPLEIRFTEIKYISL